MSLLFIERLRLIAVLTSPFSGFSMVSTEGVTAHIVFITATCLQYATDVKLLQPLATVYEEYTWA